MEYSQVVFRSNVALVSTLIFGISIALQPLESHACTSISLDSNPPVFATNYDNESELCLLFINKRGQYKSGLSEGMEGGRLRWFAGYASVSFNVGGYQLPWAGMNENGLMISTMRLHETVNPEPDDRLPLDYGPLWMQYVLDTCATVEDVIATDLKVRIIAGQDHYLVADRSGGLAVIEFLEGEMVVHTGDTLPVPAVTDQV